MTTRGFLHGILAVLAATLGLGAGSARADGHEVKIASLAPKGSAWAKIMEKGGKDIEAQTGGRVKVKYFFSAQQGDEREAVRKMKLGHLDGAAVTAVGLGLIKPDVRVLELPFLFKSDKELDHVRNKLAPEFEAQFDAAGYVLLAWGDVGWVHLYSNIPVTSRADLGKTKMWAWTDDPIVKALFKRLGVNGVPLGVPDVLPSLQTGLIDACYGPPLAAVAFQWYTKVKHGTQAPISYAVGALVVRKDSFVKLSAEDQKIVKAIGKNMGEDLMKVVRKDNDRAKKAMEKAGVQFVASPDGMLKDFTAEGMAVWDSQIGSLYPRELLDKVKRAVAEVRK